MTLYALAGDDIATVATGVDVVPCVVRRSVDLIIDTVWLVIAPSSLLIRVDGAVTPLTTLEDLAMILVARPFAPLARAVEVSTRRAVMALHRGGGERWGGFLPDLVDLHQGRLEEHPNLSDLQSLIEVF